MSRTILVIMVIGLAGFSGNQIQAQDEKLEMELRQAQAELKLLRGQLKALQEAIKKREAKILESERKAREEALAARLAAEAAREVAEAERARAEKAAREARELLRQLDAKKPGVEDLIKKRDQEILQLTQEKQALRNQAIANEQRAKAQQARAEALLAQVRELTAQLAKKEFHLPGPGEGSNPPMVYVKGAVTKVNDSKEGLVEISLGTDHGLKKGHTLEVFRLQPRPEYLGRVRIIAVEMDRSVGQMVSPAAKQKQIKVGDSVASSVGNEK